MLVLLEILVETLLLLAFLWIGKSVMKAQIRFKALITTSLAGALASQVPFVGMYLSFAVVLFFLWKMARVEMVPDGALILIIGKGAGFVAMIYVVAIIHEHVAPQDMASFESEIAIYVDDDGISYYSEEEKVYYLTEEGEKVYVDANGLFGLTAEVASAETEETDAESLDPAADASAQGTDAIDPTSAESVFVAGFSEPYLSDMMVRGNPTPFQIFVPQGWSVEKLKGSIAIRLDEHTYINCYSSEALSNNKSYLRKEVNRVMSQYSGYEVAKQELITMDKRQWARIQFMNRRGDQILLMTHGGNFGCFTVELNGSYQQLSAQKSVLNRIVSSFKFPPTTYLLAKVDSEE